MISEILNFVLGSSTSVILAVLLAFSFRVLSFLVLSCICCGLSGNTDKYFLVPRSLTYDQRVYLGQRTISPHVWTLKAFDNPFHEILRTKVRLVSVQYQWWFYLSGKIFLIIPIVFSRRCFCVDARMFPCLHTCYVFCQKRKQRRLIVSLYSTSVGWTWLVPCLATF